MNEPKRVDVPLRYGAVSDSDEPRTTLTMRPPLARDSRDAQQAGTTQADAEIQLFANLCEVAPQTIEELHMADYVRLQKAYERFLA